MPSSLPVAAALGFLAQAAVPAPRPTFQEIVNQVLQQFQGGYQQVLVFALANQLVLIIAYWLASKPVADEERSGFGSALKVYFLYLLVGVAIGVVAVFTVMLVPAAYTLFRSAHAMGPGGIVLGMGAAVLVVLGLSLYCLFAIPMSVYRIGVGGTIVFLILVMILDAAGSWGLNKSLGQPLALKRMVAPNPLDLAELRAGDRTKTITERQAALKEIYDRLEAQRATIPEGDSPAKAEYLRRRAKYENLLNELRADVAEHRGDM